MSGWVVRLGLTFSIGADGAIEDMDLEDYH
jgi:hypothetical protein